MLVGLVEPETFLKHFEIEDPVRFRGVAINVNRCFFFIDDLQPWRLEIDDASPVFDT